MGLLQAEDPQDGGVHLVHRDGPLVRHGGHVGDVPVQSGDPRPAVGTHRDQENIHPRADGQAGSVQPAEVLGDGVHLQGVGDHHPIKAHVSPEDAGDDGLGQGGGEGDGLPGRDGGIGGLFQLGELDVGGHNSLGSGVDGRLEGGQLICLQPVIAPIHPGEAGVAVRGGVAVAGEVLEGGNDPRLLHPPEVGHSLVRGGPGIVGEGPQADDGIGGLVVDVQHRGEVHVQALSHDLLPQDGGQGRGVRRAVRRPQGHVPRAQGPLAQAGDVAHLLVHGQEKLGAVPPGGVGLLEGGGETEGLGGLRKVLRKEDDPGKAVVLEAGGDVAVDRRHPPGPPGGVGPGPEGGHDHLADLLLGGHPGQHRLTGVCGPAGHGEQREDQSGGQGQGGQGSAEHGQVSFPWGRSGPGFSPPVYHSLPSVGRKTLSSSPSVHSRAKSPRRLLTPGDLFRTGIPA